MFDQETAEDALARMLFTDGHPFSFVKYPHFNKLFTYLQPEFCMPSEAEIKQRCMSLYVEEIKKLRSTFENLNGFVSLTLSSWADVTTMDYVCVTAHYIDNSWKMKKRIVNFMLTPLSEPELSESLLSCLAKWKIKNLFSISLENSLSKSVTPLQLKNQLYSFSKPGTEVLPIPCIAQIFTVLAREGLDFIDINVQRIRDAVQQVEVSEKFYKIASGLKVDTKKKLYMDIPMLWHSTYLMLENTLQFRKVFIQLESKDFKFLVKPTDDDWNKVMGLCKFLKMFYKAVKLFSDRNTTADMYFFETWKISMNLNVETNNSDPFISSLAARMHAKFDEYWTDCFVNLAIATVLDPRNKMMMVEFCLQKLYAGSGSADLYVEKVRAGIQKLYDNYADPPADDKDVGETTSSNGDPDQFDIAFLQDYGEFLERYYQARPVKSELEVYLEEKVHPRDDKVLDVLTFWRLKESRFPTLARLARDVLAMPIVSLASQSVFQIGSRVLEERYIWGGHVTLEARICMQNWFHEKSKSWHATILDGDALFDEKDFEEDEEEEEEICGRRRGRGRGRGNC